MEALSRSLTGQVQSITWLKLRELALCRLCLWGHCCTREQSSGCRANEGRLQWAQAWTHLFCTPPGSWRRRRHAQAQTLHLCAAAHSPGWWHLWGKFLQEAADHVERHSNHLAFKKTSVNVHAVSGKTASMNKASARVVCMRGGNLID